MSCRFDVMVIGAGSVGTPLAMSLSENGVSVVCIDSNGSAGQGNNKSAIGGIRATHGEPAKVVLCLHSLETFRTWKERFGDDIGWYQGGYTYVAYDEVTANLFRTMIPGLQEAGLDIHWKTPEEISTLVPGITSDGLVGGTFSPGDGSANPMSSCYAFFRRARELGASFRFGETVASIVRAHDSYDVRTDVGDYSCGMVVNCGGATAPVLGRMLGVELPIHPDSHEAGITEPVQRFFSPMVVDIRKAPGSANYYFYQHDTGQIVFCITPDPPIMGTDSRETSEFLPMVSRRMVKLYPRLANLKVRRTWRGGYPQTPDGSPIIGQFGPPGHYLAVGMCGQGFMLGPGVGDLMARLITGRETSQDLTVLEDLRLDREFASEEALK